MLFNRSNWHAEFDDLGYHGRSVLPSVGPYWDEGCFQNCCNLASKDDDCGWKNLSCTQCGGNIVAPHGIFQCEFNARNYHETGSRCDNAFLNEKDHMTPEKIEHLYICKNEAYLDAMIRMDTKTYADKKYDKDDCCNGKDKDCTDETTCKKCGGMKFNFSDTKDHAVCLVDVTEGLKSSDQKKAQIIAAIKSETVNFPIRGNIPI